MLQSFENLADVVTAIKTDNGVKVMMSPARGDIMARDKSKFAKGSNMVSAQIPTVSIHVLHGES